MENLDLNELRAEINEIDAQLVFRVIREVVFG